MDKRTVSSAHQRIDTLEKEMIALSTEVKIQFKDLFTRVKRLEAVLVATSGATIIMLLTILTRMAP
jgi:hypothetical protein|tara:strand:+ start:336 stop:533 length:198 start_codon:yes stop_codon:yes gene_type:complete